MELSRYCNQLKNIGRIMKKTLQLSQNYFISFGRKASLPDKRIRGLMWQDLNSQKGLGGQRLQLSLTA